MKIQEIKDMSAQELTAKSKELKEDIFRLKWQKELNQLENTAKIKTVRKELARVLTVLSQKNK